MKSIVDTTVWSLLLRRHPDASLGQEEQLKVKFLRELIVKDRVVVLGPVRQEILSGIKHQAQFEKLKRFLRDYRDEQLGTEDYEEAARLCNVCRSRGVGCGPTDMLICTVAIRRRWEVLSNDKGLDRCMEIVRSDQQRMRLP
jgi:predicted nucleic acid-binding protein